MKSVATQTSTSVARKRTSRSRGPKTTSLTKKQKADVSKIARAAVQSAAELKSYYTTWVNILADNLLPGVNPCYNMTQGATAEDVNGEKIRIKNIQISGMIYSAISSGYINTALARIMVIHSRDKLFTGNQSNVTALNIFRAGGSGFRPFDALDKHKVNVLMDYKFSIEPDITGQTKHVPFEFVVPLNKTETFDSDASGYFKDGQYFIIATVYDGRGAGSNYYGMQFNTAVNYTDI